MCDKPLKPFRCNKRLHLNYKERKFHLKCWKEREKEYWFNIKFCGIK